MKQPSNNAAALFTECAKRHPDRVAFFHGSHAITFNELDQRVSRFAGGLADRRFAPSDRAIVMLPMSIDLYVALLAVLKIGGIAVFLDPWVGRAAMIRLAVYSRPTAYLGTVKSHLLRLFRKELRKIPIAPWRVSSLDGNAVHDVHPVEEDDRALITFTTGSSGNPKGVNRTHRILRAQHEQLAQELPAQDGDVDLCTFPVFALNNLALGIPTLIPKIDFGRVADANGEAIAEDARRHNVTTMSASPPLFDRLVPHAANLQAIREIRTGGAPVSDAQLSSWRSAFPTAKITVVYGSTEAEPVAHIDADERLTARSIVRPKAPGYLAGKLVAGVTARVIPIGASSTTAMRDGEIGELIVSGDHVCRDYDGDPDAVKENKIIEGDRVWHRMGDTGYFDHRKRFWIAGRVHSTIHREGEQVHPQLLEQAAQGDDPRVVRAAAIGIDDRVVVVVESTADVAAGVRSRVEAAGLPCDEVVVSAKPLPVDPRHNSKIDYEALKRTMNAER